VNFRALPVYVLPPAAGSRGSTPRA
jgi:hypothetical protein